MGDIIASRLVIPIETNAPQATTDTQRLSASIDQLSQKIGVLADKQKQIPKSTDDSRNAFLRFNDAIGQVQAAVGAFMGLQVISFLKNTATECINAAISAQEVKESFVAMTGSMEAATAVMQQIQEIKDFGVFTRGDINTATQQLLRMGVSADEVGRTMNMLSNYAAGAYIPLNELTNAYARSAQTGVVTQRQLMAFGSFLGTEFRDKVRAGTATFADLQNAMLAVTEGSGQFANAIRTRAEEPEAAFMRLENSMQSVKVAIGEGLLPAARDVANALGESTNSQSLERWRNLGTAIGAVGKALATIIERVSLFTNVVTGDFQHNLVQEMQGALEATESERREIQAALNALNGVHVPGLNPLGSTGLHGGGPEYALGSFAKAKTLADQQAADTIIAEEKAKQSAIIDDEENQSKQRQQIAMTMWGSISSTAMKALSSMASAEQQHYQSNIQRIKALYDYQKDFINANVTDEKEKAARLHELDVQKDLMERREKKKAFEASQKYAIAQIQISTAQGITAAWANAMSIPYPGNLIVGGLETAMLTGLMVLQMSNALSAQPPTAQQGGSFEVPPGFGADSALLRVNSGERVDVTPARNTDNGGMMVLKIGERDFEGYMTDMVNRIVNSGNVVINRKGAVRVA